MTRRPDHLLPLLAALLVASLGAARVESAPPDTETGDSPAQTEAAAAGAEGACDNPMVDFARLVGGEWKISLLSHRFEWGIGNRSVIAKSYDDGGNLAAEARWFWHPGEGAIKGYSVTATGEGFAEMTTRFDGDTMINTLQTIAADGTPQTYTGHWKFTDRDRYDWTLYAHGENGQREQMMQATATRAAQAN